MAASPKSMMTTSPRLFIMMFCGFRSRWMMPRSWAAASPAQSLRAVSRALSAGRRPMRGRFGQELQRHGLSQGEVGSTVDFAHAAAAQQSDDAIASAQQGAREKAAFVDVGGGRDVRGCPLLKSQLRRTSRRRTLQPAREPEVFWPFRPQTIDIDLRFDASLDGRNESMPATTRLAQLMSTEEGFGKLNPDGTWTVPTRDNNPLDLRHSPHSSHAGEDPNDIGIIDTIEDGWADAERQLQIYAERGMTLP